MKNIFISICVLLAITSYAQAESLYRWVDKEGRVHYGDKPAEDATVIEKKKFAAPAAAGDDDLSYNTRKAKQDFPVTLYASPSCGDICAQARSFLNKRGIPYTEKLLVTKEDIDAYIKLTGANNVPALTVGKNLLSGFAPGQWHGELDIAGYPKAAPYGSRPVPPATVKPEVPAKAAK